MDKETLERLKQDLAIAVKQKDTEKINHIRQILNISEEQANIEWTKFVDKFNELGLSRY